MSKRHFFFVVLIFLQISAWADSSNNMSFDNRRNKTALITLGTSFSDQAGMASTTFTVGKVLNEKNILEIEASSYSHIPMGIFFGLDKTEKWGGSSVGIHYRYFATNSLNIKMGLDSRNIAYNRITDNGVLTFSDYTADFNTQSTVASISLGNQWQWESATFGIDWIGYSQPVSGSYDSIKYTGNVDAAKIKYTEDQAKKLALEGSSMALKIHVGASF